MFDLPNCNDYIDGDRVVIEYCYGGDYLEYLSTFSRLTSQGYTLYIRNDCASSCTLALLFQGSVEWSDHAAFLFHPLSSRESELPDLTAFYSESFPMCVQRLFRPAEQWDIRYDPSDTISGRQLRRSCN